MKKKITVISCGIGETLPETTLELVRNADLVAGSRKLLEQFAVPAEIQRSITAHVVQEIESVISEVESGKTAVVLGSGDALFHGIGGTVQRTVGERKISIEYHPAPTAFQHLCAREGILWDSLNHYSIHGGTAIPLREIVSSNLAVIYCGSRCTASELAAKIAEQFPESKDRLAVVADSLNSDTEQIIHGTVEELSKETVSPTSMLLLKEPTGDQQPLLPLGTPNDQFEHESNLITAEEVRAIAIAKLRLPVSGVIWDIGAGSGSVGIEAAAMRPHIELHAVEQKPQRIEMIRNNCRSFGIANATVHERKALDLIETLPTPDRIFVGGGGKDIVQIVEKSFERLSSGGIMVVTAVTLETIMNVHSWNCPGSRESLTIDIAKEETLGVTSYHMYRSSNRITLFVFRKEN